MITEFGSTVDVELSFELFGSRRLARLAFVLDAAAITSDAVVART
jgi:hypothetical protein